MKQIFQDMANGESRLVEAPSPRTKSMHILITTTTTLISAGTERMLVDFGKANLIEKAKQQPDKVKMVLEKVQTDGLMTTIDAVRAKLGQPLPLGYCNVGVISAVGKGCESFKVGQRVVSNGPHADIVRVAKNLCAVIPENVTNEEASFTVVASIGLQGIRLANPTLGESFVVTGVGLIGLLTVQMLKAQGCRVLAIDFDQAKLELAKSFGAEICNPGLGDDPISHGFAFSRGNGVDGVIITASTKSNDPVSQGARMSRKRGRIILVGVTGLELSRADFYEKELSFQVSCSYGPGRYDPIYEETGNDYPLAFVRWTEQRNFEAILDMISSGMLDVKALITHRFEFEEASKAYKLLTEDKSALGILLNYSSNIESRISEEVILSANLVMNATDPVVGFIGAGNYASRMLIPAFKAAGAQLHTISTSGGVNGVIHGKKSGFKRAITDTDALISDPNVNTIAVVTRHNTHAMFVEKGLKNNKNVFVEKPLAINLEELEAIKVAYQNAQKAGRPPRLMVGFNRRFSPHIQKMKSLLAPINEPKAIIVTVNAGMIPAGHWTQNIDVGGGRVVGEACHFVDLVRFLVDSKIVSVDARRMGDTHALDTVDDKATITLGFADGSFGTILYLANGASSFPKERVEVFTSGKILQLDNFVKLKGYGWKRFNKMNLWKQDKGQTACSAAFIESVKNGTEAPIPVNELFEIAKVTIDIAEQLRLQK